MAHAKVDAIILAGGKITGAFAHKAGARYKCFIRIANRFLVERAVDALRGSSRVGRIAIVGPARELTARGLDARVDVVVEGEQRGLANAVRGFEALQPSGRVLLLGSDLPFITGEAIDDFIGRCPPDADICYPVIARGETEARFSEIRKRCFRLGRECLAGGGGAVLVNPGVILANRQWLEAGFASRRSQLGLARKLGVGFLLRYVLRRVTLAEIEARGSGLLGCKCQAVRGVRPELAIDVDTEADFDMVRRQVEKGVC